MSTLSNYSLPPAYAMRLLQHAEVHNSNQLLIEAAAKAIFVQRNNAAGDKYFSMEEWNGFWERLNRQEKNVYRREAQAALFTVAGLLK